MTNRLAQESSPYLQQHADNQVDWYPWGPEALERAEAEDRPILLSVGYSACHWCHVMAHESFEDEATAALMNASFINIKVDREERPDIDRIYQSGHQLLTQRGGGWPLTMFLNSEKQPFWGGTYFPKTAQYGRPSFTAVLKQISEIYQSAPDKVKTNTEALQTALTQQPRATNPAATPTLSINTLNDVASQIHTIVDPMRGGLQGAPKFPQVPIFQMLWRHYLRTGDKTSKNQTLVTLQNICQGGIYDHLGGGFARYSVDVQWLAPHFEKMLYDNAQLIDLLTTVWQGTKEELFRIRINETIDWVQREMVAEHGAFAASLDADSDGEEGTYYVWNKAQIEDTLKDDSHLFNQVYDVQNDGNWEGKVILNRLHAMDLLEPAMEKTLQANRETLFELRETRNRPERDDKILTDWNGLMIASIANCALVFGKPKWLELAVTAYQGVKHALYNKSKFHQSHRAGQTRHPATADGYANMIRAALSLLESTQNQQYLQDAKQWTANLNHSFWNEAQGGYFYTGADCTDLIRRSYSANDEAIPNANATMMSNLSKLYALTGDQTYRDQAAKTIEAFTPQIMASGIAHAGALNGFEDVAELTQIVIVGNQENPEYESMMQAVLSLSIPNRQLISIGKNAELDKSHPAYGKKSEATATVYICKGQTCTLPITNPKEIEKSLSSLTPHGAYAAST